MSIRPIISFPNAVGALMLGYALAIQLTPSTGAMGYIRANTPLDAHAVALIFVLCGGAIALFRPAPPLFSLLATPFLLYAIAAVGFFLSREDVGFTGVMGHLGVWLIINAVNYERARQWK
jgi:hypothetical protein